MQTMKTHCKCLQDFSVFGSPVISIGRTILDCHLQIHQKEIK